MEIKAKLYPAPNVTITFPDNAAPITNIRSFKVKRYPDYFKVTAFGDRNWTIRLGSIYTVGKLISEYTLPPLTPNGLFWESSVVVDARYDVIRSLEKLPIYGEVEPDKELKDFGSVAEKEIKETAKNFKGEKNMNQINVINGAITFTKELAFAVNGKYKTVTEDGVLKEVLPQFVIAKNIPALVPTVAKKIEAGTFYSNNGKLYKALADNKVMDLDTGIITEIAVTSIPMTDAVIVYKPLFGNGKVSMKEMMKAQMLSSIGGDNNPFMLMTLLGEGDDVNMEDMVMLSMMNKGGTGSDTNALLPLMLLKDEGKDEDSALESLLFLQAAQGGKADANALQPLLMMKLLDKKEKKPAKKAD